jgi:hypothetical protein
MSTTRDELRLARVLAKHEQFAETTNRLLTEQLREIVRLEGVVAQLAADLEHLRNPEGTKS